MCISLVPRLPFNPQSPLSGVWERGYTCIIYVYGIQLHVVCVCDGCICVTKTATLECSHKKKKTCLEHCWNICAPTYMYKYCICYM